MTAGADSDMGASAAPSTAATSRSSGIRSRISATALDQAVAGASNVLIEVVAARELDVQRFGLFTLLVLVYAVSSQFMRAVVGDPLLVHPVDARLHPEAPAAAVAALAALVAVALGGAALIAELRGAGPAAGAIVALAVAFPLLALQDLGRYIAFARGEPSGALRLDSAWMSLMLLAFTVLYASGATLTLPLITLAWCGSGAVAGVPMLRLLRSADTQKAATWLRGVSAYSWRYVTSFLATQGSVLLASFALTWIAGASAMGAVRGVQLLTRPFMTLHVAAVAATVSTISDGATEPTHVRRLASRISAMLLILSTANCVVLLVLPTSVGEALLGQTWHLARALVLPACLQVTLFALWTGARVGLIGLKQVNTTVRLDLAFIPVTFVVAFFGALWGGALGFYWGGVVLQAGITASWWHFLWRLTRVRNGGTRPQRTSQTST